MVPVHVADPDVFVAAATDRARRSDIAQYRDQLLESGASRPEWCFVAERDELVLGRIALWSLPGATGPSDFVLDLDWHRAGADSIGAVLVRAALDRAARLGRERLQHVLNRPALAPQWKEHPDQRRWLLERHGFVLRRTTLRFEYVAATAPRPKPSGPLRFRSLVGVGEQQFRDVIAEVTRGSLDSYDRAGGPCCSIRWRGARAITCCVTRSTTLPQPASAACEASARGGASSRRSSRARTTERSGGRGDGAFVAFRWRGQRPAPCRPRFIRGLGSAPKARPTPRVS